MPRPPSDPTSSLAPANGGRPRAGTLIPLSWWHDPRWQLGSAARDLLLSLLSWSADHLADGRIPAPTIRMLAAMTDAPDVALERLVQGGVLELDALGVGSIPENVCALFNLSADQVAARRSVKAEAGHRGGSVTASRTQPLRGPGGTFQGTVPKQPPKHATEAAHAQAPKQNGPATEANDRSTEARLPAPVSRTPSPGAPSSRAPEGAGAEGEPVRDMSGTDPLQRATDDEASVFAFIARNGAAIPPASGLGVRLVKLLERRGVAKVLSQAELMARSAAKAGETLGDRQWVFGLENALDKIPTAVEARQLDGTEEARRRSERVREQARAGAVERYSHTGEWDAARWGPPPAEQMGPAMDRPAIVANGAPR